MNQIVVEEDMFAREFTKEERWDRAAKLGRHNLEQWRKLHERYNTLGKERENA